MSDLLAKIIAYGSVFVWLVLVGSFLAAFLAIGGWTGLALFTMFTSIIILTGIFGAAINEA